MEMDQQAISSKYEGIPFRNHIDMEARGFRGVSQTEFEDSKAWGIATAVDVYGCAPDVIRSRERIVRFTHELCDRLGVKRFGETQVIRFGDDPRVYGYSMVQLIETSLVSAHFAEDSNAVYLDIFSCKWYDAEAAAEYAREFFQAERAQMKICLRH
jgi:S-adenosylmethionine/arginine decarboxylase-like enzyme